MLGQENKSPDHSTVDITVLEALGRGRRHANEKEVVGDGCCAPVAKITCMKASGYDKLFFAFSGLGFIHPDTGLPSPQSILH